MKSITKANQKKKRYQMETWISQRNKKCEKHKYVDKHSKISYFKKKL